MADKKAKQGRRSRGTNSRNVEKKSNLATRRNCTRGSVRKKSRKREQENGNAQCGGGTGKKKGEIARNKGGVRTRKQ